ncbi:MAG: hypothetical protein Q9172_006243 [Xanthocarpia lactea]
MLQLQRGTNVDVVLKEDQPSGKLTTGQIAAILTKGDHPRGIKVRLTNGQIGRVQSLSDSTTAQSLPSDSIYGRTDSPPDQFHKAYSTYLGRGVVQDARDDGYDAESSNRSSSLFNYIRPAKQPKATTNTHVNGRKDRLSPQLLLESEFPKLDSTLIAAILADYAVLDDARGVLKELSRIKPLKRCLHLLELFHAKANRAPISQELRAAREHDDSFWDQRDILQPFPFVATCLTVGCSFDPDVGYQEEVHPEPFNTTFKEVEYDEGITVLDITYPDKVKYCFAVLPGQLGVTWPTTVSRPMSADNYLSRYYKPPGHVSRTEHGSDNASLNTDDIKDEGYERPSPDGDTRRSIEKLVSRFAPYQLMNEEALKSVWSEEVDGLKDPLEHDRSHHTQVASLRNIAMDQVIRTVLKAPILDKDVVGYAHQLPDFKPRLRSKLLFMAQDGELPSSAVTVSYMEFAFWSESHVDLSIFSNLTAQCLVEAACKILKDGNVKSLDLSHLRQLSEADMTKILDVAAHLDSLYLLEMTQISLKFLESTWNEPEPFTTNIYHTETLRRPFTEENHTYSKLVPSIKSPDIKVGQNNPVKHILWANVYEDDAGNPCLHKIDGGSVNWTRMQDGSWDSEPTLHLAVFPFHDGFYPITKIVTGLTNFLSCTRKLDRAFGMIELGTAGFTMAKSFALSPSTLGEPTAMTNVGPLPEAIFNAASVATKCSNTVWPLPFPELKKGEWSILIFNDHRWRKMNKVYHLAMIMPKTENPEEGYKVESMESFLEHVVGNSTNAGADAIEKANLLEYWKRKTPFLEMCPAEEIHELLPAFKKTMEVARKRKSFHILKRHIWNRRKS